MFKTYVELHLLLDLVSEYILFSLGHLPLPLCLILVVLHLCTKLCKVYVMKLVLQFDILFIPEQCLIDGCTFDRVAILDYTEIILWLDIGAII